VTANSAKRRKRSVLQPGYRTQRLQPLEFGILGASSVERLQLGDRFTAVSDHEHPALPDLLQISPKPGL
jgi:hypothetical protein